MAAKTVTDKIDTLACISEPAFNIAALLRCAREAVLRLEDDIEPHSTDLHAIQRTLQVCIEKADAIGDTAGELPRFIN